MEKHFNPFNRFPRKIPFLHSYVRDNNFRIIVAHRIILETKIIRIKVPTTKSFKITIKTQKSITLKTKDFRVKGQKRGRGGRRGGEEEGNSKEGGGSAQEACQGAGGG